MYMRKASITLKRTKRKDNGKFFKIRNIITVYLLTLYINNRYCSPVLIRNITPELHSLNCVVPFIHQFFSVNIYYSTTWPMAGWTHGCRTMDTQGQIYSDTWILDCVVSAAPPIPIWLMSNYINSDITIVEGWEIGSVSELNPQLLLQDVHK